MGMTIRVTITTMSTIMARKKRAAPLRRRPEVQARRARESRRTSAPPSFEAGLCPAPQDDGERLSFAALYRLLAWLSPAFPVGAFSYSSGIEWAVESGDITDEASLQAWLMVMLTQGGGYCDAVLFAQAHRAVVSEDYDALREVVELAAVFTPSKERHLETTAQGNAFVEAARTAWACAALDQLKTIWDGPIA